VARRTTTLQTSPRTTRRSTTPRFVPAAVTELSRVPLFASLPGELLTQLARRMEREEIPPGKSMVREGEGGDRFYVVLSGLFAVSQESLGPRRLLRPGDYFGEVALALDIPRTASVRAMTPGTVASCDRETFDEFIRPLFAEDEP
jgi:ATP-binding cassette, subfamily B, bacterial